MFVKIRIIFVTNASMKSALVAHQQAEMIIDPSTMIPLLFDVFGLPWPCQNYPRGCREILIESELENHEINFVFRLVNCVDNFCTNGAIDKKIVFKDALDHFENDYETSGPNFQPAIKVEGDKNSFVFQVIWPI